MEQQGANPPVSRQESESSMNIGADFVSNGWTLFAGVMIGFIGFWNVFQGFLGLFRSTYFIGHPVFGNLWIWALAWILFGLLEVAAGGAVMSGRRWGRWFGIVVVGLNTLLTMLSLDTYPFWSLVVLAVQFAILYGLTVRWVSAPA
jgi:hypothetical protein